MEEYRRRIVDEQIAEKLRSIGAVLVVGPRGSGKTTSTERICRSSILLRDPEHLERYRQIASLKVSNLLIGENPRLIDEWQLIPGIWNAVRMSVDRRQSKGLYILTGSSTFHLTKEMHSGAGRIARVTMRTMSLYESGDSNGQVSLGSLFEGAECDGISPHEISDIAGLIVRGGWPGALNGKSDFVEDYMETILSSEITIDGKRRNRTRMELILRSLSRNVSTSATKTTIRDDVIGIESGKDGTDDGEHITLDYDTLDRYIDFLKDIYLIEDMPAWSPKLRSRSIVRKADVRYLADPAIAAYYLGCGPKDLEFDPETFGLLFECLVVRDLRVYAQATGGKVYRYADNTGLEVDCIIHRRDGRWGAVEIKLSDNGIEKGARSLLKLKEKVDVEERNKLAFMAVVTSTGYAYTRADGVHVVPIGCLKDRLEGCWNGPGKPRA